MKQTRLIMGMPITICVADKSVTSLDIEDVFTYFKYVDARFSPFKHDSEVSQIDRNELNESNCSDEMKEILKLSRQTKKLTDGYFDVYGNGKFNPSGLVKGLAISNAARLLKEKQFENFYVDAGGDIQAIGNNGSGDKWKIGIRNPFNRFENVKVVNLSNEAIATSGIYIRGDHIYNPHSKRKPTGNIVSISVIGSDIYDADRLATAAFAMGDKGIEFIEKLNGFEGYMINRKGVATFTSNFNRYV